MAEVRRSTATSTSSRAAEPLRDPIDTIADRRAPIGRRELSLFLLCEQQDQRLLKVIAAQLEDIEESEQFKAALVAASEKVRVLNWEDRAMLRNALGRYWRQALASDGPVIWSAIRRFGSLLENDRAIDLLPALLESNPTGVQQVAVQTLAGFFTRPNLPAADTAIIGALVLQIAKSATQRMQQVTGAAREEWVALALSAFASLAAIGETRTEEGIREFGALVGRVVRQQLGVELRHISDRHQEHVATSTHACRALPVAQTLVRHFGG